jgi:hypothetical protein
MMQVVVLFIEGHPVSYRIAKMLVERDAIVVEVVDDSPGLPGTILLHQGLRNIPVVESQDGLDVMR